MTMQHELPLKQANDHHISLLKAREGHSATIEFRERYPDAYYFKLLKVNDGGTFTGILTSVAPCI